MINRIFFIILFRNDNANFLPISCFLSLHLILILFFFQFHTKISSEYFFIYFFSFSSESKNLQFKLIFNLPNVECIHKFFGGECHLHSKQVE
jgi:hypothetical protein